MKRVAINGSVIVLFFFFLTLIDLGGNPEKNTSIEVPSESKTTTVVQPEPHEGENQIQSTAGATGATASDLTSEGVGEEERTKTDRINLADPEMDLINPVSRSKALSMVEIAQNLCDMKLYREGIPWANDALRLDPGLAEAHLISGYINFKLLNTDEAIAAFERTIELDPSNFEAHLYLGIIYNGNEDPTFAMEYLSNAIQLADCPKDISIAFAHRALSYALLEQYDKCFEDFDDALYHDPNNGWAIFFRGIILEELAERERAASEAEGIPGDDVGFTK